MYNSNLVFNNFFVNYRSSVEPECSSANRSTAESEKSSIDRSTAERSSARSSADRSTAEKQSVAEEEEMPDLQDKDVQRVTQKMQFAFRSKKSPQPPAEAIIKTDKEETKISFPREYPLEEKIALEKSYSKENITETGELHKSKSKLFQYCISLISIRGHKLMISKVQKFE